MSGTDLLNCECTNVVQYTPGIWKCRICRRVFVPADLIEFADEQLDVEPVKEIKPAKRGCNGDSA